MKNYIFLVAFTATLIAPTYASAKEDCTDTGKDSKVCVGKDKIGYQVEGERAEAMFRIKDSSIHTPLGKGAALVPQAGRDIENVAHKVGKFLGL